MNLKSVTAFAAVVVMFSCAYSCARSGGSAESKADRYPPLFPDYADVTVPCNIAPLNFSIKGANRIRAEFASEDEVLLSVERRGGTIDIPLKAWQSMMRRASGGSLSVKVSQWSDRDPRGVEYKPFAINISADSIDSHIAYRLIEPGYEGWLQMGIYQRDLGSFDEKVLVDNSVNEIGCVNCHSFADYSPERMMFHARGNGGGTVFFADGDVEKVDLKQIGPKRQGVYPMWHPEGRYVVFSSNDTFQSFFGGHGQPLEVYDQGSDLIIYDTKSGSVLTDERFLSEDRWETFPAWSPDGRSLYFCSAAPQSMPLGRKELHYDLLRVDFDPQSGALGAKVDTLYNSTLNGGSVSFPRVSPDGEFLLYTRSDYATFPVWHDEADLAMMRTADGSQVDVSALNSSRSESYHSWSSSGRWVVVGSRRLDGRYTRLFIAHISSDGVCGKPFLLPQRNPDHNIWRLKSYNIPEFVRGEVHLPRARLKALFNDK